MWKLGRDFDFSSRNVIRESMADLGTLANNVLGGREKWSLDGLCQNLVSGLRITFWAESRNVVRCVNPWPPDMTYGQTGWVIYLPRLAT